MGEHAQYIEPRMTRAGKGEALKDVVKMHERYGHGVGIRILDKAIGYVYGRGNRVVRELARWYKIPVINMADDTFHPTQALADYAPLGFTLDPKIIGWAKKNAEASGAVLVFTTDFREAVEEAHAVFPRSWTSPKLVELG